jgi:hypothetical protein
VTQREIGDKKMEMLTALVLYLVLGLLGSATYILIMRYGWKEPPELIRRLILGAIGGFLMFLLVLGGLVESFLTWIASFFGGTVLVPIDSAIGFLMAFGIGGYWCVDFIEALMNRLKPTEKLATVKLTPTQQLLEAEKGTELGRMLLNAQRKLMLHGLEKKGIKEFNLSDQVVLAELRERVKAGKEATIYRFV